MPEIHEADEDRHLRDAREELRDAKTKERSALKFTAVAIAACVVGLGCCAAFLPFSDVGVIAMMVFIFGLPGLAVPMMIAVRRVREVESWLNHLIGRNQ